MYARGVFVTAYAIYIPLWFYSNAVKIWQVLFRSIFTFHYGSILIDPEYITDVYDYVFTFHYGSILINGRVFKAEYVKIIYIPLWFYSNQMSRTFIEKYLNLHSTMVLF